MGFCPLRPPTAPRCPIPRYHWTPLRSSQPLRSVYRPCVHPFPSSTTPSCTRDMPAYVSMTRAVLNRDSFHRLPLFLIVLVSSILHSIALTFLPTSNFLSSRPPSNNIERVYAYVSRFGRRWSDNVELLRRDRNRID